MSDLAREFWEKVGWMLLFAAIGIGVIFGLDALVLLSNQIVGCLVGLFLGCCAVVGAEIIVARR